MYLAFLLSFLVLSRSGFCQDNSGMSTLQQLNKINADLATNYKLDDTLPFLKTNTRDQDGCTSARLRPRQGIPLYDNVEFFDWNTLYRINHVEITNNNHTDAETINDTGKPSTLSMSKSTAVASAVTSGWTVTGKGSFTGFDILGQYQSSTTHTTTQTETVTNSITCGTGELCRIQTFTFTATIYGTCYNQTWIHGDGDADRRLCKDGGTSGCAAVKEKYDEICTSGADTSQPDVPCVVNVPIFDGGSQDGSSVLSLIVETSQPA